MEQRRGTIVALEGPSAVGKSTVAALLARRLDAALIAEATDRIRPPLSLRFDDDAALLRLETRLLDEEARRFAAAVRLAARGTTVVADTGFWGPVSYTAGLAALDRCRPATFGRLVRRAVRLAASGHLGAADFVAYLVPDSRESLDAQAQRAPAGHPPEFRTRHREVGMFELAFVRPFLARNWGARVATFLARGSPSATTGQIARKVGSVRPVRDRHGRLERLLRAWGADGLGDAHAAAVESGF